MPSPPRLCDVTWKRFLRAPDQELVECLYVPALSRARTYDRSCAYFSSSVLAAAARGFGAYIERLLALGDAIPKPAIRLVVNEELARDDVDALLERGDTAALERALRGRLTEPAELLERERLGVLAWLVREGWLSVRVGLLRRGRGIVHAKYGIVTDDAGDAVVFAGSGNETASGLQGNYEKLEVSTSWDDPERHEHYRAEFERLWGDTDADVTTVPLPDAVRLELITYAEHADAAGPPGAAERGLMRGERQRQEALMRWRFVCEAPYFAAGGRTCDATAFVTMWPHQVRVVEETAAAWPDGRLLCDEVGMGKTVEAILILRRLMAGRGVRRALILLPAGLLPQWQGELREKGGLVVPRLEGQAKLVWPDGEEEPVAGLADALTRDVVLVSRELTRLQENAATLLDAEPWDLVLLDEAHAARRANQEEGEFNRGTLLLDLLRQLQLRGRARGFLLLSATPMQTHPWEPWDLLSVLGEGAPWLADFGVVRDYYDAAAGVARGAVGQEQAWRAGRALATVRADGTFPPPPVPEAQLAVKLKFPSPPDRAPLAAWLRAGAPLGRRMHRNGRDTLRAYYARGLLDRPPAERRLFDQAFTYDDPDERELYDAVKTYVDRRFRELEDEKPGKGFVMTVYRRRAASSPHALRQSLTRRADGLRRVTNQAAADQVVLPADAIESQDLDELADAAPPGKISAALPDDPDVAAAELREVHRLLDRIDQLGSRDAKRDTFLRLLGEATDDGRAALVFSEFSDTITYLREQLYPKYGERLGCYTGQGGLVYEGGGWQRVSKEAITARLRDGALRLLLCTDAASEGLNLQAAGALVNYDLPWNPSRVEQRIGRVDRIGQRAGEVRVGNLFLRDSIDDQVYAVLRARCGMFRHFVGSMQPVLAAARSMLLGLRPFDGGLLTNVANALDSDEAARAAFAASVEPPSDGRPPDTTVQDVARAFAAVCPSGTVVARGRARAVSADPGALDEHDGYWPMSPVLPELRGLAAPLERTGELLPLAIGRYAEGGFRAAAAVWCHADGTREAVARAERLEALLGQWDGQLALPNAYAAAEREARFGARARVHRMAADAARRERDASERQVTAARQRVLRELARYLLCVDPEAVDLNAVFHAQMLRDVVSAQRLRRAYDLVGYPVWNAVLVDDVRSRVGGLSASRRDSVLLGKPLDAAITDPRWLAAATPGPAGAAGAPG